MYTARDRGDYIDKICKADLPKNKILYKKTDSLWLLTICVIWFSLFFDFFVIEEVPWRDLAPDFVVDGITLVSGGAPVNTLTGAEARKIPKYKSPSFENNTKMAPGCASYSSIKNWYCIKIMLILQNLILNNTVKNFKKIR